MNANLMILKDTKERISFRERATFVRGAGGEGIDWCLNINVRLITIHKRTLILSMRESLTEIAAFLNFLIEEIYSMLYTTAEVEGSKFT